jgi:hypothetical protein
MKAKIGQVEIEGTMQEVVQMLSLLDKEVSKSKTQTTLKRDKKSFKKNTRVVNANKRWTTVDDSNLRQLYKDLTARQIAHKIGRTPEAVCARAATLKLYKK